jgi:hypothetical protein
MTISSLGKDRINERLRMINGERTKELLAGAKGLGSPIYTL